MPSPPTISTRRFAPLGSSNRLLSATALLLLTTLLLLSLPSPARSFSGTANNPSTKRVFVSTPASKAPKRTVGDCMNTSPVKLTPDLSVDEAIATLLTGGLEAAVVVNGGPDDDANTKDRVVGIVTSFDFLQREAFGGSLLPMEGSAATVEGYVGAAKKICAQRVSDVMTPNPRVLDPDMSMREAAAVMAQERLHRLPVVREGGVLVGMITASDVMLDVLNVVREIAPGAEEEGGGGGDVAP